MYAPKAKFFSLRHVDVDFVRQSDQEPWLSVRFNVEGCYDVDEGLVVDSLTFTKGQATWYVPNVSSLDLAPTPFREAFGDDEELLAEVAKRACRELGYEYN